MPVVLSFDKNPIKNEFAMIIAAKRCHIA